MFLSVTCICHCCTCATCVCVYCTALCVHNVCVHISHVRIMCVLVWKLFFQQSKCTCMYTCSTCRCTCMCVFIERQCISSGLYGQAEPKVGKTNPPSPQEGFICPLVGISCDPIPFQSASYIFSEIYVKQKITLN